MKNEYYRYGVYSCGICIDGADTIKEARAMADTRLKEENKLFPNSENQIRVYRLSTFTGLIRNPQKPDYIAK